MKTLEQMSRKTVFQMVGSSITGSALSLGIYSVSARKCTDAALPGRSQCSNAGNRLALSPRCRTVEIPGICGIFRGLKVLRQTPFRRRDGHLDLFYPKSDAKALAQGVLQGWQRQGRLRL